MDLVFSSPAALEAPGVTVTQVGGAVDSDDFR